MPQISVSRESVIGVRNAICAFQADVESATAHMRNHGDQLVEEIQQSICQQQERVNVFKERLKALEATINQCENKLSFLRKQQAEVAAQIDRLNVQAQNLNREIQYWEQQRSTASRDKNTDAVNQCTQRIFAAERQMDNIRSESNRLKELYGDLQREDSDLCRHLRTLEGEKEKTSVSLKRAEQKFERMKSAGDTVMFQMERFLDSVSTFQAKAISTNTSNLSGIDRCLSTIDEYMNTNL